MLADGLSNEQGAQRTLVNLINVGNIIKKLWMNLQLKDSRHEF